MAVFEDRTFEKEEPIKMRPLEWALIQSDWCPYKKRRSRHTETTRMCRPRGKTMWRGSKRTAIWKPRRETSERAKPDPGLPASRTLRSLISVISLVVCVFCYGSPSKCIHSSIKWRLKTVPHEIIVKFKWDSLWKVLVTLPGSELTQ